MGFPVVARFVYRPIIGVYRLLGPAAPCLSAHARLFL